MAVNGYDIIILRGGTAIAGTRSQTVNTSCDVIEVSSPLQGTWREYMASRKEWSVNVDYIIPSSASISQVLTVGTTYTLIIRDRNNASNKVTGDAICIEATQEYQKGAVVKGSFTFKGVRPLT